MLAAQGKWNLAVVAASLVSLFAVAIAASTHGLWRHHKPTTSGPLDSSQYLKLFRQQQESLVANEDDDDTSGRLAFSPPQLAGERHDSHYASLPLIDEARRQQVADQLRRQQLASRLQLARKLLAERMSQQQQLDLDESPLVSAQHSPASSLERSDLLALLASHLRPGDDDDDDDNPPRQSLTQYYSLSSKPLAAPLVSSPEPGDSQVALDEPLFGQNNNNNNIEEQQSFDEPKSEYFYELQQEEKRDEPSGQPQLIVEEPEKRAKSSEAAKYTTLLEDEEPSVAGANETASSTTTPAPVVAKVNTRQPQVPLKTSSRAVPTLTTVGQNDANETKSSIGSMLGQFFSKIRGYLPFIGQTDTLSEPKGRPATARPKVETKPTIEATEPSTIRGADAKPSVSDSTQTGADDQDYENNDNNNQVEPQPKDKIASKAKISEDRGGSVDKKKDPSGENDFRSLGTFANVKVETESNKNMADGGGILKNSKRVHIEADKRIDSDLGQEYAVQQQAAKVNLLRAPNKLVVPISSSHDELVVQQSSKVPGVPDGIVSRYIYAPTHHYYLTPDSKLLTPAALAAHNNDMDSSDSGAQFEGLFGADQLPARMSHRSFESRHQFIPGEQVFSSYNNLKPAYAFQKNGLEEIALVNGTNNGNRTNDIYFLVMVGAFCVMAMAVVLAAGMFAYRVQQNRKSSQETEYPTYGVVGPNNIDGKCGAAAFMGGYLGGAGPGSSGSFGSKSGSAKHLADMYASDSGLASTDKGSSKKASLASASSATTPQDSHQQQSSNRASPAGNFSLANNQDAARMYHYQHQKQQMIISDRGAAGGRHTSASDLDSEEENDEGSYTVYECPGLASAHEMEIKNPLFNDDHSP